MQSKCCKWCGKEFEQEQGAQKYCEQCRELSKDLLSGKRFDFTKPQICAHCGKEFHYNRKRKYCDDECTKAAMVQKRKEKNIQAERKTYTKICKNCDKEFTTEYAMVVQCSDECVRLWTNKRAKENRKPVQSIAYTCKHCGVEYHPWVKQFDTYCSRECYFEYRRANPKVEIKPINPKLICVVCGKEFEGRSGKLCCSTECNKEKNRIYAYQQSTTEKECCWCGEKFIPEYKGGDYTYCCPEHKRLAIRKRGKDTPNRKLHKGGVSKAKRQRIYSRDGCTCKLCGKKMRMDKADTVSNGNPHPFAPTVDHVIPVSIARELGWTKLETNAENNLQAAHFVCNVKKGNKAANDQLLLFG